MLTRADIEALIPHSGAMCLLDSVLHWDSATIRCVSRTHRDAANPLRTGGQLPALCGIEYAAQAMAAHGGLAGTVRGKPGTGYLASLRNVACNDERLDQREGDLVVEAERLMGDETRVIYQFRLRVGEFEVLNGRATVVLNAA
ncbi:MAG TPA: hydroxymyristoyl-ACP dehydratase [Burkholderiales bacterium]|nr:hydroxymyristoyl-ACP dehydratase [Burkholderiales bacterium]